MKLINLETGRKCETVKSDKGFKVIYRHGTVVEKYVYMRAVQTLFDEIYVVWDDYAVTYTGGFMFISLETGEKFIVVRD